MRKAIFLAAFLAVRCSAPAPACDKGALGIEAGAMQRDGVTIAEVVPRSPADLAGLTRGDVLVSIGGRAVRFACQVPAMAFHRDCAEVRVVVRRDGNTIEKMITPVEQTTLYEEACKAGDPTSCYRFAWVAATSYDEACQAGSAEACAAYGYQLMNANQDEAVEVLERACDRGSGAGCAHLAYLYSNGSLVPKNDLRAMDFYTRGCNYGDARSCYSMGVLHDQGRGASISAARAATAYEQACAAGVSMACTDLGYLFERGLGTMRDPVRAADMYRRGCEGSPCEPPNLLGCVNLGKAYRDGTGVPKDPARAVEIFADACGRTVGEDEQPTRTRACVLLGAFEIDGLGIARNVESGLARSLEGCTRGDAIGCFNAGAVYSSRNDFRRAAEFFDKSCKADDGEACFELAVLHDEAKGVAFDSARSASLFRRACTLGFLRACGR